MDEGKQHHHQISRLNLQYKTQCGEPNLVSKTVGTSQNPGVLDKLPLANSSTRQGDTIFPPDTMECDPMERIFHTRG